MDGIGTRGKWKKKCPIDILAFLCMLMLASGTPTSQPSEKTCSLPLYKTDNGICCNKCHQGYKLTKECQGDGRQSTCEPCEKGKSYNAFINYSPNCRSCTKCKGREYEEEESKCATDKDTVCRCKNGFYKDKIDSETFQCLQCTECGMGQKREQNCTQEHNTVCRCADGHYADKSKCLPCELCTASECKHLCHLTSPSTCKDPNSPGCEREKDGNSFSTALLIGVSATTVLLVVVGFITYKVTKDTTTRKLVSTSSDTSASSVPPDSADCTEVLIDSFEEHPDNVCDKAFPPSSVCMQDPSNLPDCIPKISELIYTVLHLVPVARVKELARKLDVPDIEIERAEADHRLSKEAHYQMLKVWADRGLRAGGAALVGRGDVQQQQQQPWLQELLAKLEDMNLGLAAQELEKKYSCQ